MSRTRSLRIVVPIVAGAVLAMITAPHSVQAQYPQMKAYVCQTPTFWCAIQAAPGFRNGTPCGCYTYAGPVAGYSIDPVGVQNAPGLPTPQSPSDQTTRRTPPTTSTNPPEISQGDCYKGLGNCPGSFTNAPSGATASRSGAEASSSRKNSAERSDSDFSSTLKKLIKVAEDGFVDIKGKQRSQTSRTISYNVTVSLPGFDRCWLAEPKDESRRKTLSCSAPEGTSLKSILKLVSDALGRQGTREGDDYLWTIGEVDVYVSDDGEDVTLDITSPKP